MPLIKQLNGPENEDEVSAEDQFQCGSPGQPQNGTASITFQSSKAVAKYECPGSFIIDGDAERTCRDDGTWTGTIPRCATEAPGAKLTGNEKLADGKLETCDWIHAGNALVLKFEKKFQVYGIKIIYPAPYKDSIEEAEFEVHVLDGDQSTNTEVNRTFHERDSTLNSKDFSSVQWRLKSSGDAVRVRVNKGNIYICKLVVYTSPEECGRVEEPRNGHIEYTHMLFPNAIRNDSIRPSALYRCDTHYEVMGASARMCFNGHWNGEQSTCRPSDIQWGQIYVFIIVFLSILSTILVILSLLKKFGSKCQSRLSCGKNGLQNRLMKTSTSPNVQCHELQKMNPRPAGSAAAAG